jgi:hypothetical protein
MSLINKIKNLDVLFLPNTGREAVWLDDVLDVLEGSVSDFETYTLPDNNHKVLPNKNGWFWVLIDGYTNPTPCWYMYTLECFLPGGMGDDSSNGLYIDDIEKIGPEIIEPKF